MELVVPKGSQCVRSSEVALLGRFSVLPLLLPPLSLSPSDDAARFKKAACARSSDRFSLSPPPLSLFPSDDGAGS